MKYLKPKNTKQKRSRSYPEDDLQMAVASFLDYQNVLWFHVANERLTSQRAGVRLKKKGVKSGVPDVMILEPRNNYTGLAVELKIKPNTPTDAQISWLKRLEQRGYRIHVCYSLDEFLDIYKGYFS